LQSKGCASSPKGGKREKDKKTLFFSKNLAFFTTRFFFNKTFRLGFYKKYKKANLFIKDEGEKGQKKETALDFLSFAGL
jgi:hypothetical protein